MTYSVRHITNFHYQPAVRESVMEVRVQPRSEARQRCLSFSLDLTPRANMMLYRDFLGNTVHHFDIPGQHQQIQVAAHALVEVMAPPVPEPQHVPDWEKLDACIADGDFWEMLLPSQYTQPTALLEELAGDVRVERRGNPLELLLELNEALYRTLAYVPNSTKVDSPIDDALRARRGVCQDFAHIMTALVRRLRIPCRYVSGYLFQEAKSKDRSSAGATHAWVEAFLGDVGWVAFDPTNKLVASERHIRVALGRDYADVPPTRGVYKGDAESTLSVMVTVTPVNSPQPEELPPATVIRSRRPSPGAAYQDQQQQ
ncbi:MAG TPA: transglutaminase family protein [Candidatus Dormibacteraeota bacterium]|nr:transglutaminase family protein [Candidatus Dormibacteraeota bacterium]